jgi:hypothetical protein
MEETVRNKKQQICREDFCCEGLFIHLSDGEVGVVYSREIREYGIKILDGGTSIQVIRYCPWCGAELPEPLRDEWFDTLRDMGYPDPCDDDIPSHFRSDKWWKDKYGSIQWNNDVSRIPRNTSKSNPTSGRTIFGKHW